jgi:hypothetical protein
MRRDDVAKTCDPPANPEGHKALCLPTADGPQRAPVVDCIDGQSE